MLLFFGCTHKLYNVKVVPGVGYVRYSERKKGEMSKDILSNNDTLCAMMQMPFHIYIIDHLNNDTTYLIK